MSSLLAGTPIRRLLFGAACVAASLRIGEARACKNKAAAAAFAAGDLSGARLELSRGKRSQAKEKCSQQLWADGTNRMLEMPQDGPIPEAESKVADIRADGTNGCRFMDVTEAIATSSLVQPVDESNVALCLHLADRTFTLEQDAFLRLGDASTVLWPAGLRLAEWLASNCNQLKGRTLEVGAGVGFTSIAAAVVCKDAQVLATDKEPHAMLNLRLNAGINSALITARVLDLASREDVSATLASAGGPFDTVLAADVDVADWTDKEWEHLARLVLKKTGKVFMCLSLEDVSAGGGVVGGGRFTLEPLTELRIWEGPPPDGKPTGENHNEGGGGEGFEVDPEETEEDPGQWRPESYWIVVLLRPVVNDGVEL